MYSTFQDLPPWKRDLLTLGDIYTEAHCHLLKLPNDPLFQHRNRSWWGVARQQIGFHMLAHDATRTSHWLNSKWHRVSATGIEDIISQALSQLGSEGAGRC